MTEQPQASPAKRADHEAPRPQNGAVGYDTPAPDVGAPPRTGRVAGPAPLHLRTFTEAPPGGTTAPTEVAGTPGGRRSPWMRRAMRGLKDAAVSVR